MTGTVGRYQVRLSAVTPSPLPCPQALLRPRLGFQEEQGARPLGRPIAPASSYGTSVSSSMPDVRGSRGPLNLQSHADRSVRYASGTRPVQARSTHRTAHLDSLGPAPRLTRGLPPSRGASAGLLHGTGFELEKLQAPAYRRIADPMFWPPGAPGGLGDVRLARRINHLEFCDGGVFVGPLIANCKLALAFEHASALTRVRFGRLPSKLGRRVLRSVANCDKK